MSLFVWIGYRFRKEVGRPSPQTIWLGNILSALFFGLGHIDNFSIFAEPSFFLGVFGINSLLGLFFGWLFWRYGLEAAMLSHFLFDALGSAVMIPVYLWNSLTLRILLTCVLLICGLSSLNVLRRSKGVL